MRASKANSYWFFVSAEILICRQNTHTSWGFVGLWLIKLRSGFGGWRNFAKWPPFCLVTRWKPESLRASLQVLSKRTFPRCYSITLFFPLLFFVAVVVALSDTFVGFYHVRSMLKCFLLQVTGNAAFIQPLPAPFVSPTTVPGHDVDLLVAQWKYQHSCDPSTHDIFLPKNRPVYTTWGIVVTLNNHSPHSHQTFLQIMLIQRLPVSISTTPQSLQIYNQIFRLLAIKLSADAYTHCVPIFL